MAEAKIEGTSVTLTHHASAPIERVFRAFTEVEELSSWFGPEGFEITLSEMDARIGGAYRITMQSPEGEDYTVHGVLVELIEPTLIAYTWSWEEDDEADEHESLVTIRFAADAGGTQIELVHTHLASEESVQSHTSGWTSTFNDLDRHLA